MKRLFMLLCAVVAFAACEQAPIKEMQGAAIKERNLEVSFEGGDDTRIQLQNGKTVWTEGDHVSVFYRSTVNEEWQFMGEAGDRTGQIVPVDNTLNPPATHNRVVVIYPYNSEYYLNTETYSVEASLPAVQNYLEDSYGTNGNIMVSSGDYKQVSLKSVCGWLKLQLTGDGEVVKSITLRGNNGEQVAGELHINTADATSTLASELAESGDDGEVGGTLVRPGTILTEVTLNCGTGVELGAEATAFYIALPPQTFEAGFTVEIEAMDGHIMTKSTNKALTVERNHIQPMTVFVYDGGRPQPNNEIWYTATAKVEPYYADEFGATYLSNVWDSETGKGIITFEGDVTKIGYHAFQDCTSFTSVTIPDSVTTIGVRAFADCYSLTSVTIPDSVTTIGREAFEYCTRLTSVTIPDNVTTIWDRAFGYCYSLTSVTIPDGVTTIGEGTFSNCKSLTSVNIPDSVTTIGGQAFYHCTSLTSVNIPDSVTEIGWYAFAGCISLTSVNIPDSATSIGLSAFECCTSLTSVTIPDSVTEIRHGAFSYCDSLKTVYCKATTPPALGDTNVFDSNGSGRKIYVPVGSVNAYKSAEYWIEYASAIVGYNF